MKILVSAYACEPGKGSEQGVGWNWVKQIAKFHEVWVITRDNNKEVIETELQRNHIENIHFCYFDLSSWMKFWKKGERGLFLYYYLWQLGVYFLARKLHSEINFDCAHHITFVNSWLPSFLCLLPIPFIWGPIGENQAIPLGFLSGLGIRNYAAEMSKILVRSFLRNFDPFYRICLRKAKSIIVINEHVKMTIPEKYRNKVIVLPAIGIEDSLGQNAEEVANNKNRFMVFSAGRLIYRKGFHLAILGFADFSRKISNTKFILAGDGPDRKRLECLINKKSISEKIIFTGKMPRNEVFKNIANCDVFLYPSFEGGGIVVLEAMIFGKPVVCLDFGGPGEMVIDECGIKIKPGSQHQVVRDLTLALEELEKNPDLRKQFGENARKRVNDIYSWEKKGEKIKEIYHEVLGLKR